MLQAQLRGMIGDFKGGDEMLLSQALEAFDTLTNTTTEYRAALEGKEAAKPMAGMSEASKLQPPTSNPFQVNRCIFNHWRHHTFLTQPMHWGVLCQQTSSVFSLDLSLMHIADNLILELSACLTQRNGCDA